MQIRKVTDKLWINNLNLLDLQNKLIKKTKINIEKLIKII